MDSERECPVCGAPVMHPMQAVVVVDESTGTMTGHPCYLAWLMEQLWDRACQAVVAQYGRELGEQSAAAFVADLAGVEGVEDLLQA